MKSDSDGLPYGPNNDSQLPTNSSFSACGQPLLKYIPEKRDSKYSVRPIRNQRTIKFMDDMILNFKPDFSGRSSDSGIISALDLSSNHYLNEKLLTVSVAYLKKQSVVGVCCPGVLEGDEDQQGFFSTLGDTSAMLQVVYALAEMELPEICIFLSMPRYIYPESVTSAVDVENSERQYKKKIFKLYLSQLSLLMPGVTFEGDSPRHTKIARSRVTIYDPTKDWPDLHGRNDIPTDIMFFSSYNHLKTVRAYIKSKIELRPFRFKKLESYLVPEISFRVNDNVYNSPIQTKSLKGSIDSIISQADSGYLETKARVDQVEWDELSGSIERMGSIFEPIKYPRDIICCLKKYSLKKSIDPVLLSNNIAWLFEKGSIEEIRFGCIYGIHHRGRFPGKPILNGADDIMNLWYKANKKIAEKDGNKTLLLIKGLDSFLPNLSSTFPEHKSDDQFVDLTSGDFREKVEKLDRGTVVLCDLPSLPPPVFHLILTKSRIPALAEGANLTSQLLEHGFPYLLVLPSGDTTIPFSMGDPLEAIKINALSFKLQALTERAW